VRVVSRSSLGTAGPRADQQWHIFNTERRPSRATPPALSVSLNHFPSMIVFGPFFHPLYHFFHVDLFDQIHRLISEEKMAVIRKGEYLRNLWKTVSATTIPSEVKVHTT